MSFPFLPSRRFEIKRKIIFKKAHQVFLKAVMIVLLFSYPRAGWVNLMIFVSAVAMSITLVGNAGYTLQQLWPHRTAKALQGIVLLCLWVL